MVWMDLCMPFRTKLACIFRSLYNNAIASIPSDAFSGLRDLTSLLVFFALLAATAAAANAKLTFLIRRLYNNNITSIASGAFSGLGKLTSLWALQSEFEPPQAHQATSQSRDLAKHKITSIPRLGNLTYSWVLRFIKCDVYTCVLPI